MNLLGGVAQTAMAGADAFETLLLNCATANINGFSSVTSMALKIAGVGAATGVALAGVDYIESLVDSEQGTTGFGESAVVWILGFIVGAYCAHALYRDRMLIKLTGGGMLKFKAAILGSCLLIPIAIKVISADSGKKKTAAKWGMAIGLLIYVLIGIVPVIVREQWLERQSMLRLKTVFQKCYPVDLGHPCDDELRGFVQTWDSAVPDWLENMFGFKNKANVDKYMDAIAAKQAVDMAGALWHTPLAKILKNMASAKVKK